MIKNGISGAKTTKNGNKLELKVQNMMNEIIQEKSKNGLHKITQSDINFEMYGEKHALYKMLTNMGVNYASKISKKILPDKFLINTKTKELLILEVKYQEVSGSVDEKLQTGGYKVNVYEKLFADYDVKFRFILNDWFQKPEYKDILSYINSDDKTSYMINPRNYNEILGN